MASKSNSKYERRFLECKVLLDKKIRCTSSFRGTNGSGLKFHCKNGKFSSNNVTLKETSINHKILRIPLARDNLQELKQKYKVRHKVPRLGRKPRRYRSKSDQDQNITRLDQIASKRTVQQKLEDKTSISKQKRSKTLNKVIKKPDKLKIKFFPRHHNTTQKKNGAMQNSSSKPMKIRREILFVKQYRNEKLNKYPKAYYLQLPEFSLPIEGKLNYKFQDLATDVKTMKLPSPTWKIKVIIRRNKISGITFTNKKTLERCLSFYSENDKYDIVIDNQPAFLLGSPGLISNKRDVEILLDIVQNIDSDSRMILYK